MLFTKTVDIPDSPNPDMLFFWISSWHYFKLMLIYIIKSLFCNLMTDKHIRIHAILIITRGC